MNQRTHWILFSLVFFLSLKVQAQAMEMPPTPVRAVQVTTQSIENRVMAQGEIKAFREVILQSDIAGKVSALHLEEGLPVPSGKTVIQLDDSIYQAQLTQAEAQLENSQLRYNRLKKLANSGTGSPSEMEEALADLRVQQANASLAKINIEKTQIKAPFSGILGLKDVDIGDYITPGQPLVSLVDISKIIVDFKVPEKYALRIRSGMTVQLSVDALSEKTFIGEIYALAPTLDHVMRSRQARAVFANQDSMLKPGLFSRLKIVLNEVENALVLPEEALIYQDSRFYVYKIEDGKVLLTEIKLGIKENGHVQVTEGLNNGEQVVLAGQIKLFDGAAVQVIE